MTTEIVKQFNDILESFLIQISPLVGTSYHYYFKQFISYNAIMPIEQFLVYALPLREKIINRDETYFANNDNHTEMITSENALGEILRLQNIYRRLDTESQSNVWDIFQAMLHLGEEYVRINPKFKKLG